MVCLVVATVVQVVVEMVVKLFGEDGFFGGFLVKEVEVGGMGMLWLLEKEWEMEKKEVVVLVVKMEVE